MSNGTLVVGLIAVLLISIFAWSLYTKPAVEKQLAQQRQEHPPASTASVGLGRIVWGVVLGNLITGVLFAILYQVLK